jgi:hypothetical protein
VTTSATARASRVVLLVAAILAIAASGSARAHGDPASHYLETDALYPSFARQPSVEVQLELLGLLQAAERRGYPVKVALVAGVEDLVEDVAMMRTPQRYAGSVASMIDRELEAPVLVVTPFGLGVSGNALRNGVLQPVTIRDARRLVRGLEVPADPQGDDLARTAMAAVRRLAHAAGRPLPARVPPAAPPAAAAGNTVPVERAGDDGDLARWIVPAGIVVGLALLLGYRRRRYPSTPVASCAAPTGLDSGDPRWRR